MMQQTYVFECGCEVTWETNENLLSEVTSFHANPAECSVAKRWLPGEGSGWSTDGSTDAVWFLAAHGVKLRNGSLQPL